jgi:hypothetical protein
VLKSGALARVCLLAAACMLVGSGVAVGVVLPDGRGYEMVSPPQKAGGSVAISSSRTRAAGDGSAVSFMSLTPFGDALGSGVESEYMAQRTGQPGTPGWVTHAITPRQDPITSLPLIHAASPGYVGEFSPDLGMGVFRAWSPLTNAPDVARVENLYMRDDLRTPGLGTYTLLTGCPFCAGTPLPGALESADFPAVAGTSSDFAHVLFESNQDLTGAGGGSTKLYMSDGGAVRLVGLIPAGTDTSCGGSDPPCVVPPDNSGASIAGIGATQLRRTPHVLSPDGTHTTFSAPVTTDGFVLPSSSVYQQDSHGTASTADDTTVKLNVSERMVSLGDGEGIYQTASADGSRVFFTSRAALTDDAPSGPQHLYMWDREHLNDEVQRVTVSATGGTFTLTYSGQTTSALAWDATGAQVKAALEALTSISGAGGSVEVTGGPGDDAGTRPYLVTFGGALAGADVDLLTADGTSLTGTSPAANVDPWVRGGGHLTLIDRDNEPGDPALSVPGGLGASDDGHYVYFVAQGQLVAGGPSLGFRFSIYLWHDGAISYVGTFTNVDWPLNMFVANGGGTVFGEDNTARVSPDGRALMFSATSGAGLTGYSHDIGCGAGGRFGCIELYAYHADTGELTCVSCNPLASASTVNARTFVRIAAGATVDSPHLSHALSDDGRFVFFSTPDALVVGDTNGRQDAYEYDFDNGQISLISTGKSTSDSYFVDASADGRDVFFATKEQLVGWDVDTSTDIYDARIAGGFPDPALPPPVCGGSACQGPLTGAPPSVSPGSSASGGSGNLNERLRAPVKRRGVRCRRGRVRRRVHGRVRCVRRHVKAKHTQANRSRARHAQVGRGVRAGGAR